MLAGNVVFPGTDEWTAKQVGDRTDLSPEQVCAEWAEVGPELEARMDEAARNGRNGGGPREGPTPETNAATERSPKRTRPGGTLMELGKILLKKNLATQGQIDQALELQKTSGGRLGDCLVSMGLG